MLIHRPFLLGRRASVGGRVPFGCQLTAGFTGDRNATGYGNGAYGGSVFVGSIDFEPLETVTFVGLYKLGTTSILEFSADATTELGSRNKVYVNGTPYTISWFITGVYAFWSSNTGPAFTDGVTYTILFDT